jgi:Domain of unknown function (DUF397)
MITGHYEGPALGQIRVSSPLSLPNDHCVVVASVPYTEIGVRDTKDTEGPILRFTSNQWLAFLGGARSGEFDSSAAMGSGRRCPCIEPNVRHKSGHTPSNGSIYYGR